MVLLFWTLGCMGRCWPRRILLRGKLFLLKRLGYSVHLFSATVQSWFMNVVTSGANCAGWSCRYGKQRPCCWHYCLITLGDLPGTRQARWQHGTVRTPFCYALSLEMLCVRAEWWPDQIILICRCVICRVEFDEGESLVALPCKHPYHSECINQWLQLNKVYAPPYIFWNHVFYDVTLYATLGMLSTCILWLCQVCPMCSAEVPTSVNKQAWLTQTEEDSGGLVFICHWWNERSANC